MINIDYSKYKRFFAFGCSFTNYFFPTWADVLSKEMPQAEYYNLGKSGAGNLLISNRVAQANSKFKFCETDLVIIMWSTAYREDRYIEHNWKSAGNVYTQNEYDKNFVKNYCDPQGFMIRDLALIELTNGYLSNLSCDTHYLALGDLNFESSEMQSEDDPFVKKLNNIYPNTLDNIKPSVMSMMKPNYRTWIGRNGEDYHEGHPDTGQYYEYLERVGFPLSDTTRKYVEESMAKINSVTHQIQFQDLFPEFDRRDHVFYNGLF